MRQTEGVMLLSFFYGLYSNYYMVLTKRHEEGEEGVEPAYLGLEKDVTKAKHKHR